MVDRRRWRTCSVLLLGILLSAFLPQAGVAQSHPPSLFDGMKWRLVGPFRGGRAEAVAGVVGDPATYYFGAVAGGVWKTTDGGASWSPIFDNEPVASIGAIALAPSNPGIIYVGTGEQCLRNEISYGNGVYKSLDGGKTWTNIGLRDSRHIAKILVDPHNPDIVYVAAIGHAFGPNEERGVFRSSDGGKTWQKILYVDDKTGATDLVFDPNNPNILFAAMYQVRRAAWTMISGGPGSGLYKSTDAGSTWMHIEGHGLPGGILGRIGVAVSQANSNRVYAMIEAKENALYRSDDGGDTWRMMNNDPIWVRPWYQNHVFADPQNVDTVYLLDLGVFRSTDGGRLFDSLPVPHGDNHELWIDPTNPKRMIEADDGGATITVDGGTTWTPQNNQPTAQFYHIATDNDFNYRIYGAQQDSTTVAIRSRSDEGSIDERDWHPVGGGESGFIWPDPRDPEIVYAGDHNGHFTRYDGHSGQIQNIAPWLGARAHPPANLKHRFNWTSPMQISPHDPSVLYLGGEVLFRTADGGMSWTVISPDLTRNDKTKQQSTPEPLTPDNSSAEYYDTIFAVAESPIQKDLIWVGTDDGLVHLTRDGGKNWANVTPKQLPEWARVNFIEPSPYDVGTAYLAADAHFLDRFQPMIFKTTDLGKSWTEITSGLPPKDFVHCVHVDSKRKGLLFAGLETGMYVSLDDGANWQSLQLNLPHAPVYDMTVHGDDLVVATHGRAFWVLDNITPLRQANASIASEPAHLFTPAIAYRLRAPGGFGGAARSNVAQNPPVGAVIDYHLSTVPSDPITVEILDSQGQVLHHASSGTHGEQVEGQGRNMQGSVSRGSAPARAGMNRYVWNCRVDGPAMVPGIVIIELQNGGGPFVPPGTYQVKLKMAGKDYSAPLQVKADPRVKTTQADLQKQYELAMKIRDRITEVHNAVNQIRESRSVLEVVRKRANPETVQAIEAVEKKMRDIEGQLIQVASVNRWAALVYPIMLDAQYADLGNVVESADTAPAAQIYEVFQVYEQRREEQLARWKAAQAEVAELKSQSSGH
jgi:photosystem II stability/assembly factor-like uncharacterized protein